MINYIARRLLLLPITLFFIILVNFAIVNLAPGDPVTVTEMTSEGASRRADRSIAFGFDNRYLQFREFYGLTLPILINLWPYTSEESVRESLDKLVHRDGIPVKQYDAMRIEFGDKSRFIMPYLLKIIEDPKEDKAIREMAIRFFVRGGTRQAYLGPDLTEEEKKFNRKISVDSNLLQSWLVPDADTSEKVAQMRKWYDQNKEFYKFEPTQWQKFNMVFETRFTRYMGRVLTLNFGTLRNDSNKTVISEVTKRFKYSLTLAVMPMIMTFVLCQIFGCLMAYKQYQWQDYTLNVTFLMLYAIPVFVVAPFLIEYVGLRYHFPFTNIAIPITGFTSPDSVYSQFTSKQRFFDTLQHLFLPMVAIMYGSLASSARLSRTAILETLRQDYVRTARAKGVSTSVVLLKHVGRNAAITIVTSIAGSLGIVLGGSLIVETLFEINGFGKFFYDAVVNRDYNVIMFSAIAGSFLSLVGYLVADIAYTVLDPRVTLD
jgi:peptide/nickel transport system permease protein